MIIATITLVQFLVSAFFGITILVCIGMLVIIRQQRNKRCDDAFKSRHGLD